MKIKIPWHDPDIVFDCVESAVETELEELALDADEKQAVKEIRVNKALEKLRPWIKELEQLTVEFDLDTGIVTVIPLL